MKSVEDAAKEVTDRLALINYAVGGDLEVSAMTLEIVWDGLIERDKGRTQQLMKKVIYMLTESKEDDLGILMGTLARTICRLMRASDAMVERLPNHVAGVEHAPRAVLATIVVLTMMLYENPDDTQIAAERDIKR